jgi:predicted RNA-binding protein
VTNKNAAKGRERYNLLAREYKQYQAQLQGVSPRKIKVRGTSESAQNFRKFYQLLTTKKKPYKWQKTLGSLGFGKGFWAHYHASKKPD